jgi:hypothetical protein
LCIDIRLISSIMEITVFAMSFLPTEWGDAIMRWSPIFQSFQLWNFVRLNRIDNIFPLPIRGIVS